MSPTRPEADIEGAAPSPRWIDNHCHLGTGADGDDQVARAAQAGVARLIDVGTDLESSRQAIAGAARHRGRVFATAGVHPHEASHGIDGLAALLEEPEVVAVGESGLDYHYDYSPRPAQREVFAAQIGLANEAALPLVIHTREAWEETFAILDAEGAPERTVFHCFTGGPAEAAEALGRGALISFSGIITFGTADELRAAAASCPLDRLMVETDSPYLTPAPHRGKRNEPANVGLVGAAVADVLGIEVAAVAEATSQTAERFYRLTSGSV